jgi:hypothetical protein
MKSKNFSSSIWHSLDRNFEYVLRLKGNFGYWFKSEQQPSVKLGVAKVYDSSEPFVKDWLF